MSLFSFLGSSAFANLGYGLGGLGAIAGTYMQYRDMKKSRREARQMRVEAAREREVARRYDSPIEQARRLREAGFNPNHISPGSYGPVVTNTSGDVSPVGNPMMDMLERFGNTYNVLRSIRQSELDNEFRIKQSESANAHARFNQMIKLKEMDLRTREQIERTTSGRERQRMLDEQHKEMVRLKTDMHNETKRYHNAMVGIARKNADSKGLNFITNALMRGLTRMNR